MQKAELKQRFGPAIQEIIDACRLTDEFVDKDRFRIYLVTVWGNAVIDPAKSGISEADLEALHDYLNTELEEVLGRNETLSGCFQYLTSKTGSEAMSRLNIGQEHREFIQYFARLILGDDPYKSIELE